MMKKYYSEKISFQIFINKVAIIECGLNCLELNFKILVGLNENKFVVLTFLTMGIVFMLIKKKKIPDYQY